MMADIIDALEDEMRDLQRRMIASLRKAEIAALWADKERLDWLGEGPYMQEAR